MSKRKRQRTDKSTTRRARRGPPDPRTRGIRPWILPGLIGFAVIAVALVAISVIASEDQAVTDAGERVPSPILGAATAPVVIHEYGDYQCPFCGRFARSVKPALQEKYIDAGLVRLVWHDFAWSGTEGRNAANAARCAGDQEHYWEFHDLLYQIQRGENVGTYTNDRLKEYGDAMGLEPDAFHHCVDAGTYARAVDADMRDVRELGLTGTPSFIIGNQRLVGAQPIEVFEQAIAAEMRAQG